jgi:hypothetical protein
MPDTPPLYVLVLMAVLFAGSVLVILAGIAAFVYLAISDLRAKPEKPDDDGGWGRFEPCPPDPPTGGDKVEEDELVCV